MIQYIDIQASPSDALIRIMNNDRVRRHLVGHVVFTSDNLEAWVQGKVAIDRTDGCRVRGILINGHYAGWCGIQQEDDGTFGLGVILDQAHWGHGWAVLEDLLEWSRELGHNEIFVHLLDSRPKSRVLLDRYKADLEAVDMLGSRFNRYRIPL